MRSEAFSTKRGFSLASSVFKRQGCPSRRLGKIHQSRGSSCVNRHLRPRVGRSVWYVAESGLIPEIHRATGTGEATAIRALSSLTVPTSTHVAAPHRAPVHRMSQQKSSSRHMLRGGKQSPQVKRNVTCLLFVGLIFRFFFFSEIKPTKPPGRAE